MQAPDKVYPKGHVTLMMGLNMVTFLIGLMLAASPFAERAYPGDIDTTAHVALGSLIAALAIFRVLVAYGSIWIDVVLMAFGVLTFCMPRIQHMVWNGRYNMVHMVAGGLVILVAVASLFLTLPVIRKAR
jgi:hypothetical protein